MKSKTDVILELEAAGVLNLREQFAAQMKTGPWDESDEDCDPMEDPFWYQECQGEGRVPTEDFESYLGAMYKTCPVCRGALGDGPLS